MGELVKFGRPDTRERSEFVPDFHIPSLGAFYNDNLITLNDAPISEVRSTLESLEDKEKLITLEAGLARARAIFAQERSGSEPQRIRLQTGTAELLYEAGIKLDAQNLQDDAIAALTTLHGSSAAFNATQRIKARVEYEKGQAPERRPKLSLVQTSRT